MMTCTAKLIKYTHMSIILARSTELNEQGGNSPHALLQREKDLNERLWRYSDKGSPGKLREREEGEREEESTEITNSPSSLFPYFRMIFPAHAFRRTVVAHVGAPRRERAPGEARNGEPRRSGRSQKSLRSSEGKGWWIEWTTSVRGGIAGHARIETLLLP